MASSKRSNFFHPHHRDAHMHSLGESHNTFIKSVWTPPVSVQTLLDKVEQVEERLANLEMLIGAQVDPVVRHQEQMEVDQSRRELEDMRTKLDQAVQRLQHREAELQQTQQQLDNLTNQTAADRQRISSLEAEKKELQQLVQELESRLNERIKKVVRLEKQVAEMKKSIESTNFQVAALAAQMEDMKRQMAALTTNQRAQGGDSTQRAPSPALKRHHVGALGLPPLPLSPMQKQGKASRDANK